MALAEVNFFSQSLMRTTTIYAVIPADKMLFDGSRPEIRPFKTLYLLHGIFGNYTDWITGTRIQRWAQDHNLAVIMPSGENKFYVDNPAALDYGSHFIEELVYFTRDTFNLSHKREDTFLAGLSMGGYGAITNGLKYHDLFGRIAGLSSAFNLDIWKDAVEDAPIDILRRSYLTSVFGDLDKLIGSDKDYRHLAKELKQSGQPLPQVFLSCGLEDDLEPRNEEFYRFLKDLGYDVVYKTAPGGHDWDFWDASIQDVLEWLPLDEKVEAVSSGNVKEKDVKLG